MLMSAYSSMHKCNLVSHMPEVLVGAGLLGMLGMLCVLSVYEVTVCMAVLHDM